jgi:hypothetical protein
MWSRSIADQAVTMETGREASKHTTNCLRVLKSQIDFPPGLAVIVCGLCHGKAKFLFHMSIHDTGTKKPTSAENEENVELVEAGNDAANASVEKRPFDVRVPSFLFLVIVSALIRTVVAV